MATFTTSTLVGAREGLSDIVSKISPIDTPIFHKCNKATTIATKSEWQEQSLGASNKDNAAAEGSDSPKTDVTPTVRLDNQTQIFRRDASISDTVNAVTVAGVGNQVERQHMLKLEELKTDVEASISSSNTKVSGLTRKSAGLGAYISNVESSATQTSYSADGSNAPTAGAARALTLQLVNDALTAARIDGGRPECLVVHPTQRVKFSNLINAAGTAAVRTQTNGQMATIVSGVGIWQSDFGQIDVYDDTHMPNDVLYLLESRYISFATLQGMNFRIKELATTGLATNFQVDTEGCLMVDSRSAHAQVRDLAV